MNAVGWIGAIMLSICGAPQAWKSYNSKSSKGVSGWFLGFWGFGEILTCIYVIPTKNYPLIMNYVLNLIFIGVIVYYKGDK